MTQTLTARKTMFAVSTDSSIVQQYQGEVASLSVDGFVYADAGDYKYDGSGNFIAQYQGIISFCTAANDATLASFLSTLASANPGIDYLTFSQTVTYGV